LYAADLYWNVIELRMETYSARKYQETDDPGLLALLTEHMRHDDTWPSKGVRENGNLLAWLRENTTLGRWVGLDNLSTVLAYVGIKEVPAGRNAEIWTDDLECEISDIAEIGKLVVHPNYRRKGISAMVTRYCVRQTVEMGLIPVASAYASGKASIEMMTTIGWKIAGYGFGIESNCKIVLLTPPQQLIEAAYTNR